VAVGSKGLSLSYRKPEGITWFLSHIRTFTRSPAALPGGNNLLVGYFSNFLGIMNLGTIHLAGGLLEFLK